VAVIVALVAAAILLFGWPAPLRQPAAPALSEPVTLALPLHPSGALMFTAIERGYFLDEGVTVMAKGYPSGARALSDGLFAGEAQVACALDLPVTIALLDGRDLRILAATFGADNVNRVIARRSAGIRRPADLRGKRVATQRASGVHFFLDLLLTEHALSEKDIELSFLRAEALPEALAAGRIDAFSMREPFISQARARLGDDAVVFAEPGLYPQTELLVAPRAWIAQHPDAAAAMVRALLRAEAFAAEQPEEVIALTARRLGVDQQVVADALLPHVDLRVFLDQRLLLLMQSEARWAMAQGLTHTAAVPPLRPFIHDGPLRKERPEAVTLIEAPQ
jgi:ABC-type nitrate/sulfonate/bicarbonate transport system substrate-binding protein